MPFTYITLMTHPKLERFRARMPYFVAVSILALIMASVFIAIHMTFDWLAGSRDASYLWMCFVVVPIYPALVAVLDIIGRISGYRPFMCWWNDLTPSQTQKLYDAVVAAAPEVGFQICWQKPFAGVVAVLNFELEKKQLIHGGKNFPTRLSIFIYPAGPHHFRATMKIGTRTTVFWDSGERANCHRFGHYFSQVLKLQDPQLYPARMSSEIAA